MPLLRRLGARPCSSWRDPRIALALLGLACVALVTFASPAAVSAARDPGAAPKELLEAFPLNPTGERIVANSAGPGVFRPPIKQTAGAIAPAARPATGGTSLVLLAAIGGGGVVALLGVAFLIFVLLRSGSSQEEPSAYVSAVFVGSRRLPVIEGSTRGKPRIILARDVVPALVGCGIAVVIALLVVHYVG